MPQKYGLCGTDMRRLWCLSTSGFVVFFQRGERILLKTMKLPLGYWVEDFSRPSKHHFWMGLAGWVTRCACLKIGYLSIRCSTKQILCWEKSIVGQSISWRKYVKSLVRGLSRVDDSAGMQKDVFYDELVTLVWNSKSSDIVLVTGGFNGQLGKLSAP